MFLPVFILILIPDYTQHYLHENPYKIILLFTGMEENVDIQQIYFLTWKCVKRKILNSNFK